MKLKLLFKLLILGFFLKSNLYSQQPNQPNILLIIVDDLNDYQGAFGGHPQAITPNLDKLADSGVKFTNCQSNAPVCLPSRNSLFTGVYPHLQSPWGWVKRSETNLKSNKTIMHYLIENGYATYGSGKLLHRHERDAWTQWGHSTLYNYGPFYYNGTEKVASPTVPAPFNSIGSVDGGYGRLSDVTNATAVKGSQPGWIYGDADWVNNSFKPYRYVNDNNRDPLYDEMHADWAVSKIEELDNSNSTQPFFMAVGFIRPHTPLYAPDKYFDMYPIEDLNLSPWAPDDANDTHYEEGQIHSIPGAKWWKNKGKNYDAKLKGSFDQNEDGIVQESERVLAYKNYLQAYLACVTFADDQIGKVVDALDNSQYANNTIVIFTSDHGWQMGEKDYLFKNSPWEESCRIPLIIKDPNSTGGTVVDQPVSLIDIFPTISDYSALTGDNKYSASGIDLSGQSLKPLIENPTATWTGPNGALSFFVRTNTNLAYQTYSYRTKDWRYIRYGIEGGIKEELYDHNNDEFEVTNLADNPTYASVKSSLENEVNQIIYGATASVSDEDYLSHVSISYNPAVNGIATINTTSNIRFIEIVGPTGSKLDKIDISRFSMKEQIDLSAYSNGIYLIRVQTDDYSVIKKLIL